MNAVAAAAAATWPCIPASLGIPGIPGVERQATCAAWSLCGSVGRVCGTGAVVGGPSRAHAHAHTRTHTRNPSLDSDSLRFAAWTVELWSCGVVEL